MSIIEIVETKEQCVIFVERPSYRSLNLNIWKLDSELTGYVLTCIHYKMSVEIIMCNDSLSNSEGCASIQIIARCGAREIGDIYGWYP